jgi:hypothetical protein
VTRSSRCRADPGPAKAEAEGVPLQHAPVLPRTAGHLHKGRARPGRQARCSRGEVGQHNCGKPVERASEIKGMDVMLEFGQAIVETPEQVIEGQEPGGANKKG